MKKRGNGEGTVYKRKDGTYCAQQTIEGKRLTSYGKTKTEALSKIKKKIVAKVKSGEIITESRNITVTEWASIYIKRKQNIRDSTKVRYAAIVKMIGKYVGNKKLKSITNKSIPSLIANLRESGYKDSTINGAISFFISMFNEAVSEGVIKGGPIMIKNKGLHKTPFPELPALGDVLVAINTIHSPVIRLLAVFCLYTGLRRGELVALQWRDIDFGKGKISVNRSVNQKGVVTPPKNGKIGQCVQIPTEGLKILDELKSFYKSRGINSEYVFCKRDGARYSPTTISITLRRALAPYTKTGAIHILRHLNATILAKDGVPLRTISHQLRHASIATTDRYINEIMNEEYDEVKKISIPGSSVFAVYGNKNSGN